MMTQCTAHAQLKSVYGVSRVMCHRTPGPPIFMSKVRGLGLRLRLAHHTHWTDLCAAAGLAPVVSVFHAWL